MSGAGSPIVQAGNVPRLYTLDDQGRRRRVVNDVVVVMSDVLLGETARGREIYGDLHVKITHEGIITDAIVKGEVAGTACYPLDMLVDDVHVS